MTAVNAYLVRLDVIEVLVQQSNQQEEELSYLQAIVREIYPQIEEARERLL